MKYVYCMQYTLYAIIKPLQTLSQILQSTTDDTLFRIELSMGECCEFTTDQYHRMDRHPSLYKSIPVNDTQYIVNADLIALVETEKIFTSIAGERTPICKV